MFLTAWKIHPIREFPILNQCRVFDHLQLESDTEFLFHLAPHTGQSPLAPSYPTTDPTDAH
jgi:hypothetical protein